MHQPTGLRKLMSAVLSPFSNHHHSAMATNRDDGSSAKTRICMISDTHTFSPSQPNDMSTPYRQPLPRADILLHAGDLTFVGMEKEHQIMIDIFKAADAEIKIVIAGNHDITLDEKYYRETGHRKHRRGAPEDLARIREMYCGEDAQRHGIVYLEEGLKTFTLKSGAQFTIYTTPYQPEFCNWAFAYRRSEDRYNPSLEGDAVQPQNPIPSFPGVDLMLTHGPPEGFHDKVRQGNVGCVHLSRAVARARPRIHCFGHIHEGHGASRMDWEKGTAVPIPQDRKMEIQDRCAYTDVSEDSHQPLRFGEETLFVNAAVVTVEYNPINAPWVVDIDLPRSSLE